MIDPRAPAVVAVIVTRDPGPWFDEVLASLASQDYDELSVLVLVSGGEHDPTAQVARALPEAFVRRLPEDRGYAVTSNLALEMVEGAAFYLLCHDDCALDPDALRLMVQESFRSNAGIVSPKMTHWDDRSALLRVGMNADKTGAMVDRVQDGEVDHGQHDVVRDVFVAPGGCTLVRADLFGELGGFDPGIVAMGEDLDLSWRTHVAGGRVVVAPEARVRHLQLMAGGERSPVTPAGELPSTLQQLQRRHELRAVLTCYTWFHLLRVLPQVLALSIGEAALALVVGDGDRVRAVLGAWRWNLRSHRELRRRRAEVRALRTVPDREVRRLQTRGSARLTTYLSRLIYQGFDVANGTVPAWGEPGHGVEPVDEVPLLTGSVGAAFSEDADFDELDDMGRRSGRDRFGRRLRRPVLSTAPARLLVIAVIFVVLLLGSRNLIAGHLPLVGQFAPLGSWSSTWHQFFSGWQPAGVGNTAPATPSFAFLGVIGTVLLGGMGLVQKVLVLGCIPVGAWGVARFLRPIAAPRARLIGALCYLGLPLSYDALARGRWDGLVAFALTPWILSRLARATGIPPFVTDHPAVHHASGHWRRTIAGQALTLGVLEAVAVSFAPAMVVVVLLSAGGIVLGSLVVGRASEALQAVWVALGATLVTVVLCGPWAVGTALAGSHAVGIFGLQSNAMAAPSWGGLLRFDVGPTGGSPLSWLLLAAAFLPLLIGRRSRLAWAGRLWSVALVSWAMALVVSRGWASPFSPSVDVLLAPAAVAVAAAIGLGVASFEIDLAGYRFGWRQAAAAAAVGAVVVGLIPTVAEAANGRWGLPAAGYEQSESFIAAPATAGAYRVLWLGDPAALPLGGWSIEPGLAYATSEDGVPGSSVRWAPAGPSAASAMAEALTMATAGDTSHLGQLLAPSSVRYLVVVSSLAPSIPGIQQPVNLAPPSNLLPALLAQNDLREVPGGEGFTVFENTQYLPERAQCARSHPATTSALVGCTAVLPGGAGSKSYSGPLATGPVFVSVAPSGSWSLTVNGTSTTRQPAFGWAAQFPGVTSGSGRLAFSGTPLIPLAAWAELALWLAVTVAIFGRRRWVEWWRGLSGPATMPALPSGEPAAPSLPETASQTASETAGRSAPPSGGREGELR